MSKLISLVAVLAFFAVANAAPKDSWPKHYEPMVGMPDAGNVVPAITYEAYLKMAEEVKNMPVRKLAANYDDNNMSPELKSLRDALNKLGYDSNGKKLHKNELYKEANKLHKILLDARVNIMSKPNDYKFVMAHLAPMQVYRSIVYRMIPVVAPSQALRQSIVDSIQDAYADMKLFFPDSEWDVGFAYITEPFAAAKVGDVDIPASLPQFKNESEVQNFLITRVATETQWANSVIASVDLGSDVLVIDNRLIYGKSAFGAVNKADLDRYTVVRQQDVLAARGRFERQLYSIKMNAVYNIERSARLASEVAALYGIEVAKAKIASLIKKDPMSPTRKDRIEIVMHNEFKNSFVKNPNANKYVNEAMDHLTNSVVVNKMAWDMYTKSNDSANAFIDPAFFKARIPETKKGFENAIGLVYGRQKTVTSVITGKTVEINFRDFILNGLPQDSKNMLPTIFDDQGPRYLTRDSFKYRDYSWGRAIGWDSAIYQNLFPELKAISSDPKQGKNVADLAVKDYMRVFTESRGGTILADFLLGYVR